jgi:2,3-bisphosphoglycerate-independent phosphoglycerate mutase
MMASGGDLQKTVAAIQYVDTCLGGICEAVKHAGGVTIVTSSHGNIEALSTDEGTTGHHTTSNPVPFHLVDDHSSTVLLREDGSLADVAPTILGILGIKAPAEMTGSDLRVL